jgi:hypothetical protein
MCIMSVMLLADQMTKCTKVQIVYTRRAVIIAITVGNLVMRSFGPHCASPLSVTVSASAPEWHNVLVTSVQICASLSTTEELLERKRSGSGLEIREYSRRNPSRWACGTLYPQKLALTSPTSGDRSVGIVRSRTQATEFLFSLVWFGVCVWTRAF